MNPLQMLLRRTLPQQTQIGIFIKKSNFFLSIVFTRTIQLIQSCLRRINESINLCTIFSILNKPQSYFKRKP
jgi:hypothetical protein